MEQLTEVVCGLEFSITALVLSTLIVRALSRSMGRSFFFVQKKHKVAKLPNMLRSKSQI